MVFSVIGSIRKLNDTNANQIVNDFENVLPQDIATLKLFIICMVILAIVGGFISFFFLFFIRKFAKALIYLGLIFAILSWVSLAIYFIAIGNWIGGIIFGIFAVFMVFIFFSWRSRIPFAVEMLKSVTQTIESKYKKNSLFFLNHKSKKKL